MSFVVFPINPPFPPSQDSCALCAGEKEKGDGDERDVCMADHAGGVGVGETGVSKWLKDPPSERGGRG